jgi:hypothetical protein
LTGAKFNYTSGVAKAILDTLRAPPALTAQVNLTNHYCNCIITISNFCAANINDKSKKKFFIIHQIRK